ncbi:MAG: histidine kinase, partial [Alphaproteobacteria bacterium]|nr:histidine kinase [Alphaproteobacteria bacterium]
GEIVDNCRIGDRVTAAVTGNLAHTLKNPLTVIRSEAGMIGAPHGTVLREQADLMGRQIDWHLARASAACSVPGPPSRT